MSPFANLIIYIQTRCETVSVGKFKTQRNRTKIRGGPGGWGGGKSNRKTSVFELEIGLSMRVEQM